MQIRDQLKGAGIGKQGRSRSPSTNARAVLHVVQHQERGSSFDDAVKATAAAELTSTHTLRVAIQQFLDSGTFLSPTTADRGKGNPEHPLN